MNFDKLLIANEFLPLNVVSIERAARLRNLYTYAVLPGVWGAGEGLRTQRQGGRELGGCFRNQWGVTHGQGR